MKKCNVCQENSATLEVWHRTFGKLMYESVCNDCIAEYINELLIEEYQVTVRLIEDK